MEKHLIDGLAKSKAILNSIDPDDLLREFLATEQPTQRNTLVMWLKSLVHNCLVHPLLPFLPSKMADELHYRNGNWAFKEA